MERVTTKANASGQRPAILLIAYGSCAARGLGVLHDFENRVRERYPGFPVRWAYTSDRIRSRLALQVRRKSDSVVKAIRRLVLERFGPIIAQPLQIVPATENEVVEGLTQTVSRELGVSVSVGAPLLASIEDVHLCASAMLSHLPEARLMHEDVVFVGHGASHEAQARYASLSHLLAAFDPFVHVATLSGDMPLQGILPNLSSKRVFLVPFLSSVGKHTLEDIAGATRTSGSPIWTRPWQGLGQGFRLDRAGAANRDLIPCKDRGKRTPMSPQKCGTLFSTLFCVICRY